MKKNILSTLMLSSFITASPIAESAIIDASFNGLFTMFSAEGAVVQNTNYPYFGDETWGYGRRTQISGNISFNSETGGGSATISPFEWLNNFTNPNMNLNLDFQAIGDGLGGEGSLLFVNGTMEWGGNPTTNFSLIWDASGLITAKSYAPGTLISGVGSTAASDNLSWYGNSLAMGSLPISTTTYNTTTWPDGSGGLPLIQDHLGIGGSPMTGGAWQGFSMNIDINEIALTDVATVPVPAAVWFFGSGLIGLFGLARRKNN